jgi:3-oxoacyl-[acyl-carrier protein] reductase
MNAISKIKKKYGCLDILVNNAGLTIIERFEMMRKESVKIIYDTNVFGVADVTQRVIRLLKKSDYPCIINMSSIMAGDSDIGQTAYASSKAAIESMTKTWAKELVEYGIRVNAIAPGNVDTDMFNIIDGEEMKETISKIGMKRAARPDEIANVAIFLASKMSSYVTGEVIQVNGGLIL